MCVCVCEREREREGERERETQCICLMFIHVHKPTPLSPVMLFVKHSGLFGICALEMITLVLLNCVYSRLG